MNLLLLEGTPKKDAKAEKEDEERREFMDDV